MPIKIDFKLAPPQLGPRIERLFALSAQKILSLEQTWKPAAGTPVFTVRGRYTSRGWTEWTQGFQYGSALLQFDAMGEERFLDLGRRGTLARMAPHVSHIGVHDHGFNNLSTYGNLLRLQREGKTPANADERNFCELALKVSGAVQAARWTRLADGTGFIHSFNGPHSLFVDTIRSCRSLAVAHQLGHVLMGEQDAKISLRQRLLEHARNTARYSVYYGEGRDAYDERGRTTHEAVFNPVSGVFRCPNSQQGYSAFSTWTRGQAWAICGFAELLEFFHQANARTGAGRQSGAADPRNTRSTFLRAATATADHYLDHCCADGIPMWDTGAPNLHRLPADYQYRPSDPYNAWEPVDSSAAAIAAQGLIRLGNYLHASGDRKDARRYRQAGLTIARTLFSEPYLSTNPRHQGLILHSIYHRPNGWDYIAPGQKVPNGESSMWGDYHARELALLILREARGEVYPTFFGGVA
ncbi:MAG: Unsaturated glucuronyl hydrolase [Verrucomicrobia bacterium ADurb.Bin118]|nr:MAG: Unsaturated glucuronyl hydrolase [Verrucomicrobia bacterium ADurb.Bin118]